MAETPRMADMLTKAATEYATAKAGQVISNLGERATGGGKSADNGNSGDGGDNGKDDGDNKGFIGTAASKLGEGASPVKATLSGIGASIKGLFKRKGGSKRPTNIIEDCWVGVPPEVAFAAWTQFEEQASFTKGVESVARGDEVPEDELEEGQDPHEGEEMNWNAKIWWSKRSWKSTTVDYDEPRRISWKTEGAKGTVDGTITFTAIGDNATLMLFVLEYRSKGPIEWIGNRWRTVGRRVRLDIKHFRRYVMRTEPDELPEPEEPEEEPTEEPTDDAEVTDEAASEESEESDESEDSEDAEEPDPDEEPEEPEEKPEPEPDPAAAPGTVQRTRPRRRPAPASA